MLSKQRDLLFDFALHFFSAISVAAMIGAYILLPYSPHPEHSEPAATHKIHASEVIAVGVEFD